MGGRGRAASLAASPTMVGAITTLIVIVAVFLAYNANQGLPFVPTYRVSAEMCNASRLAPNNEVRIGGNRVGVVESIETVDLESATGCQATTGDSASTAAKVNMKLDESAKPLPDDSLVRVRYRSSFGLKYLEIERGTGEGMAEGATLPVAQSEEQVEFDDIANTFDTETRESSREVLEGFGNAFAARGGSLNQAIEALNPLFTNLRPVSTALADPSTFLERFFPELADAARIVAPVSVDNAEQFTNAAIAFGAISSDPEALRDTISSGVSTLEAGIDSLPKQRPFLRDFAAFSRLLRPGVRDLRISLPILNQAVEAGARTLPRTEQTGRDLQGAFVELEELVDEPLTKASIIRLGDTFDSANSAGQKIVPAQTVCNYWNYWMTYLTDHFALPDQFGTSERVILTGSQGLTSPGEFPRNPLDGYSGGQADGRFSAINPPSEAGVFDPTHLPVLHGNPYGPAGIDSRGNENCQAGQAGYALGEALSPGQTFDTPAFGVRDIALETGLPSLGKTDLFLTQQGERIFWETDGP
jgi:ABC-type transporter Mla subunit MlaD